MKQELECNEDAKLFFREDVSEYIAKYSTSLHPLKGDISKPELDGDGSGSGVYLKIQKNEGGFRYFVITAGHVIKGLSLESKHQIAALADAVKHAFSFAIVKCKYVLSKSGESNLDDSDFGFIEMAEIDALKMEKIGSHKFLQMNNVEEVNSDFLRGLNDWVIFSGYPGRYQIQKGETIGMGFLYGISTVFGSPNSPQLNEVTTSRENHPNLIDIWTNKEFIQIFPGSSELFSLPSIGGASGGGIWLTHFREDRASWDESKMKLIGINVFQDWSYIGTGHGDAGFVSGVCIKKHLDLIKESYSDLKF